MVKSNKGVLQQICRRLDYNQSARILKEHVLKKILDSLVLEYCDNLNSNKTKTVFSLDNSSLTYLRKPAIVEKQLIDEENLFENRTNSKKKLSNDIAQETKKKGKDSIVCTKNGQFVKIEEILVDQESNKKIFIFRKFNTNLFSSVSSFQQFSSKDKQKISLETSLIKNIVAYVSVLTDV